MRHENGSAMLWIFIGILLFAALGVAMMSGTRTSTGMLRSEEASAYASKIISFGNEMHQTVQRLKMRGCKDNQYGFDNTVWINNAGTVLQGAGHNPSATNGCMVFNVAGGGLIPAVFNNNGVTPTPTNVKSGHSVIMSMSIQNIGTSENDLAVMTFYIDKQTCLKINERLGIINPGGEAPEDNLTGIAGFYNGTYPGTIVIGDDAPELSGHSAGCFHYLNGGVGLEDYDYHFYQVLIAR